MELEVQFGSLADPSAEQSRESYIFSYAFIYTCIYLFIYTFIYIFILCLFIYLFLYSFTYSFLYSLLYLFLYSFRDSFIYLFLYSFIYSFKYSCIYSFLDLFPPCWIFTLAAPLVLQELLCFPWDLTEHGASHPIRPQSILPRCGWSTRHGRSCLDSQIPVQRQKSWKFLGLCNLSLLQAGCSPTLCSWVYPCCFLRE